MINSNLIYEIRGKQVMIDIDITNIYECSNKDIIKAIKKNKERFNDYFCFNLTKDEYKNINVNYGNKKNNHYVFTKQGIIMLAFILKSKKAIDISINIIESFIILNKFFYNNINVFEKLDELEFIEFFNLFNSKDNNKQMVFYNGQFYNAFSLITDFFKSANKEIIIIDNYIDNSIFDILSNIENINVLIITKGNSLKQIDINKDYIKLKTSNKFHDTYIIIDNKTFYHLDKSLKDLGKKCFDIIKIEDINYLNILKSKIK